MTMIFPLKYLPISIKYDEVWQLAWNLCFLYTFVSDLLPLSIVFPKIYLDFRLGFLRLSYFHWNICLSLLNLMLFFDVWHLPWNICFEIFFRTLFIIIYRLSWSHPFAYLIFSKIFCFLASNECISIIFDYTFYLPCYLAWFRLFIIIVHPLSWSSSINYLKENFEFRYLLSSSCEAIPVTLHLTSENFHEIFAFQPYFGFF